jgi:hypothetical protein
LSPLTNYLFGIAVFDGKSAITVLIKQVVWLITEVSLASDSAFIFTAGTQCQKHNFK